MPPQPDNNDPLAWHRHFAVAGNNRAWELAVAVRTPEQDEEMLNAAHSAAHHWNAVGTELNAKRAKLLLAEVHALLGLGRTSRALVDELVEYFESIDTPDWELALLRLIDARAAHAEGRVDSYQALFDSAEQAVDAIADPQDKAVVMQSFASLPRP